MVAGGGGGGGGGGRPTSGHTASGGAGGAGDAPATPARRSTFRRPRRRRWSGDDLGRRAGRIRRTLLRSDGRLPGPGVHRQGTYGSWRRRRRGRRWNQRRRRRRRRQRSGSGDVPEPRVLRTGRWWRWRWCVDAASRSTRRVERLAPADRQTPRASVTFTWILPAPAATTLPATAVTSSGATLNGTVNPNDTPLTDCHFAVSPAPPGGSTISCAQQVGSGGTPVALTALLLGLNPLTTYTARLVAADAQGTSTGAPVSFTTLRARLPAPGISKLSVTITRRHGRRQGSVKLTLSQPATLAFTFQRGKGKRWVQSSARSRLASARPGRRPSASAPRGSRSGAIG